MLSKNLISQFLLKEDLSTYDPYDVWKSKCGITVKQLYYKNKYIGIIPAGIISLYDLYLNNRLRYGYIKQEYPIVRAQAALALINLYKQEGKKEYLEYANNHIDWLLSNSVKGYSGYCWGTGFKIVISEKLTYSEKTPFSTNTPYVLEALFENWKITRKLNLIENIKSIYNFYENDIVNIFEDDESLVTSYGPFNDRIVTNAVAYTFFSYSIFYNLLNGKDYLREKIRKLYNFVASVQQDDGSWFYSPYEKNSFIDCVHSAFILKNLIKAELNLDFELHNLKNVVRNGYEYLKTNFYKKEPGLFVRFSISNKPSIVKYDLYDNSEMLYVAKLMKDYKLANDLSQSIRKHFCNKEIYSTLELFGMKKNKNTLRWAAMPFILAESL